MGDGLSKIGVHETVESWQNLELMFIDRSLQSQEERLFPTLELGSCLVARNFVKFFNIFHHIEFLDAYMKY
jgi:hypothetical protein